MYPSTKSLLMLAYDDAAALAAIGAIVGPNEVALRCAVLMLKFSPFASEAEREEFRSEIVSIYVSAGHSVNAEGSYAND